MGNPHHSRRNPYLAIEQDSLSILFSSFFHPLQGYIPSLDPRSAVHRLPVATTLPIVTVLIHEMHRKWYLGRASVHQRSNSAACAIPSWDSIGPKRAFDSP